MKASLWSQNETTSSPGPLPSGLSKRRRMSSGFAAAGVIVLWASAFVAVRSALVDLSPGVLALSRYAVAALVLWILSAMGKSSVSPTRPDLARMAAGGAVGIALYNLALNSGQRTVGAGVASLLVNTAPILTSLLSALWLKERIRGRAWFGALVSIAGVILISLEHGGWSGLGSDALLVLLAAFSLALYFVIVKPLLTRYNPIQLTSYVVWFGVLFLVPFQDGFFEAWKQSRVSTQLAVVYLGIGPAALAYVLWSFVLERMPAGRAAGLLYFIPVLTILLGWVVLGEVPSLIACLGGAVVLSGVALSQTAKGENQNENQACGKGDSPQTRLPSTSNEPFDSIHVLHRPRGRSSTRLKQLPVPCHLSRPILQRGDQR